MKTAKLSQRIEIFERIVTDDDYGGEYVTWSSIGEIWANVNVEGGVEEYNNDKVTWISKYEIECRALTNINWSTEKVIKYKGHILYIRGMSDVRQQGNRFYVKARKGNPSNFPIAIQGNVYNQLGEDSFDQLGQPLYNQSGI